MQKMTDNDALFLSEIELRTSNQENTANID